MRVLTASSQLLAAASDVVCSGQSKVDSAARYAVASSRARLAHAALPSAEASARDIFMVASDVRHAFSRWSNWPEAATRVIASMRKLDDDVKEGRRVCYCTRFLFAGALDGW